MPTFVPSPSRVTAAGTRPKLIDEVVGKVNTGTEHVSVAHMRSPQGWVEPGQRPAFAEVTYVLSGCVKVEVEHGEPLHVRAGEAVITHPNEWVRYSTPEEGGAEYIAVCTPAFSMDTVHRDDD